MQAASCTAAMDSWVATAAAAVGAIRPSLLLCIFRSGVSSTRRVLLQQGWLQDSCSCCFQKGRVQFGVQCQSLLQAVWGQLLCGSSSSS